jgi:hypothetical protein
VRVYYYVRITVPRSRRGPPRREPNPKTKSLRSHHKISSNLTEICWRSLRVRVCYYVRITVPRSTRGRRVGSRTVKLKARVDTKNFNEFD